MREVELTREELEELIEAFEDQLRHPYVFDWRDIEKGIHRSIPLSEEEIRRTAEELEELKKELRTMEPKGEGR